MTKINKGDLVLRSLSLFYIGLLIILPIVAIMSEALKGGLLNLWNNITLPQALFSLKLTFIAAVIIVFINMITGTATAWVLVKYKFPFQNIMGLK